MDCSACNGDNIRQNTIDNIKKYGVSIIGTEHEIQDHLIPMTYSIGVTQTYNKPELIIFGLPTAHAQTFINMYVSRLKAGEAFKTDTEYLDFADGYPLMFKEVSSYNYREHLCQAAFYNDDFGYRIEAIQLIYPDTNSKWPWEEGVEEKVKLGVNLLG